MIETELSAICTEITEKQTSVLPYWAKIYLGRVVPVGGKGHTYPALSSARESETSIEALFTFCILAEYKDNLGDVHDRSDHWYLSITLRPLHR